MLSSNNCFLSFMNRALFGTAGLLILFLLLTGCEDTTIPQIEAVETATHRSVKYLVKNTKENGMFEYRINTDPAISVKKKYNILRHAGAIYAMSMYYQLQPDVNIKFALKRAGRYLRDESIHPISEKENLLAVWSEPEVNRSKQPRQAKLGGTGLGLVALLSLEKIHPGFTPLSDLQSLGQFLVYMQKDDGSFYSKYIPSLGGRWDEWQSLYYPGEAALGLLMLYEIDASDVWFESAVRALTYIARSREDKTDIPADHWSLLATEKMLTLNINYELPVPKQLLINHAIQICETILQSQVEYTERPEYKGGFSEKGKITPTATRLEGLLAALVFLPPNIELRMRIHIAIPRAISFLLRAQISDGEFSGAFTRAVAQINKEIPGADKFNRRVTEVRIDYVQHALSAMIQYLHLKKISS